MVRVQGQPMLVDMESWFLLETEHDLTMAVKSQISSVDLAFPVDTEPEDLETTLQEIVAYQYQSVKESLQQHPTDPWESAVEPSDTDLESCSPLQRDL